MRNPYFFGMFSGFIGGLMGAYVLSHSERGDIWMPGAIAAAATQQDIVSAGRIRLVDASGRARAELAMSPDGGPGIFFYDTKGRNRLVVGLYSPAENEYPFVVLNDTQQQAAGIFRLYAGRETPVVVLKNRGQDRSVYGLNPTSTEPFLINYSGDGKKTSVFGSF